VNILSHRGYWREAGEKNAAVAFERSFRMGVGTEANVRDHCGELVISHDPPLGSEMPLAKFLDILEGRRLPLAINIKADGLAKQLQAIMAERGIVDWFTFDMSPPEMSFQLRLGLPVYTRVSEFEQTPVHYDKAVGVWLDAFETDWHSEPTIAGFLNDGKQVCVVSPELHGRKKDHVWEILRGPSLRDHPRLSLCTDLPEEARLYFGEGR